ncbi:MAG: Gfo/Idh/MocA family protein [Candidatus Dormibacteria bacterium]
MNPAPLRWGVLGTAEIARVALIPAIRDAGGEVAAVASRDHLRGQRFAACCGIPKVCESYQELVDADLDAVYIPLPNSLHLEWTLRALAAAKHVLCEKPLALSPAEAVRMGDAAVAAGVVLGEAVMYRYHPRWEVVRELLGEGRIGALRHIQGSFTFSLTTSPDIRWQAELGGGALYDVGSYLVSACRWLAGEPTRVAARAQLSHGVDAEGSLILEFPGEAEPISAELAYGFRSAEHQQLELIGTTGSLLIPKAFSAWRGEAIPLWIQRTPAGPAESIPTPAADPYREMVLAFSQRILGGPPLAVEPHDSELGLRVLEAARRSALSGAFEDVSSAADPDLAPGSGDA